MGASIGSIVQLIRINKQKEKTIFLVAIKSSLQKLYLQFNSIIFWYYIVMVLHLNWLINFSIINILYINTINTINTKIVMEIVIFSRKYKTEDLHK